MRSKGKKRNSSVICAVDFFCGAGGVTRGLLDAGIDVICGIDNDLSVCRTYERNNKRFNGSNVKFIDKDINKLSFKELKDILKVEKFDELMFVGCAPCQPFTNINTIKDKRKKDKSYLLRFAEFIEYFKVEYLLIENVPGIEAKKYGRILGKFKERLHKIGYNFIDKNVNSKKYGIPQNRNRRLLLASLKHSISLPEETHGKGKKEFVTVEDILKKNNLGKLKAGETDPDDSLHRASNLSKINLWRIQNTPKDGGDRKLWMKKKPVECFLRHKNSYTDVYSRMYWKKPAPTITTRFNSFSNGRFGHPVENRAISLREGALFQTFPLDYEFYGSMPNIAKFIGNAVPVEMAEIFGKHILKISKCEGA
ncbi:DNA cytosine methyltransferase [Thermodesulfobacteriota bacterium]